MNWISSRIPDRRERIGSLVCLAVFAVCAGIAALTSRESDWSPFDLWLVLFVFAIASELMVMRHDVAAKGVDDARSYPNWVFTSSAPMALAITLTGPLAALTIGIVALIPDIVRRRPPIPYVCSNLANYATFLVGGALLTRWLTGAFDLGPEDAAFMLLVLLVYSLTVTASFFNNALTSKLLFGESLRDQFRREFKTSVGAEAPGSFLTAGTGYAYGTIGLEALGLLAVAQFTFQYLAYSLVLSQERADALQRHADELAEMHAALQTQAGRLSELSASRGRLVGQVLQAEEVERRRLAEALHDEALQELLAARQGLAPVEDARAERARDSVSRAIDQLRGTIFDLHPAVLEHAGLAAALADVADNQATRAGFRAEVDVDPAACGDHDSLLFVLGREQLVNAAKHSGATDVGLVVSRENGRIVMEVSDNGRGMKAESREAALREGHIGLASSADRVEALGGELEVDSTPGRGTRIRTTLPVEEG